MKIRTILPLLLFLCTEVSASSTVFFDGTWDQARKLAKKENKYIFLDCWTEWCGYCKMMDNETFVDSTVVEFMQKNFISLSRDMERGEGRLLNMKYHTSGYPTFLIFTPKGELCYELSGYMKPAPWLDSLRYALQPEHQQVCTGYSDELDVNYPEFYKQSFGVGDERKIADSAEVASWLDKQTDLSTEICWAVLWFYKGSYDHQQWMFENGNRLYGLYGKQVWYGISGVLGYRGYLATKGGNATAFEEVMLKAEKYLPEPYRSERIYSSRSYYYKTNNQWSKYTLLTDEYFSRNNYAVTSLNEEAWLLYENTDDTTLLNIGIKWIEYEFKRDSSWYTHDTYACLLFKIGRFDDAELHANIAIEKAGKAGEVPTETIELLDKIRNRKKQ